MKPAKRIHLTDIPKIKGLSATVEAPGFGVSVKIKNETDQAYRVALTGAVLKPGDNAYQRLLVLGTKDRIDHVFLPSMNVGHCVFVPPNGEVEAELETCCMDESLSPPDGSPYRTSTEMAPDRLVTAARAFCTSVSMGQAAPVKVTRDMVQDSCWDRENEATEKVLDEAVESGHFK